MKLNEKVSWLMGRMQQSLFPCIEGNCYLPLTDKEKHLIKILEFIGLEKLIKTDKNCFGRPRAERRVIARCFIAKSVLRYKTTRDLIYELNSNPNLRAICGFRRIADIPSESTFSRAFAEFAHSDLGTRAHNYIVEEYLADELIGHVNRDSTAIKGREKKVRKKQPAKVAKKRGRPAKGEVRPERSKTRLELQVNQSPEESFSDLPRVCDHGIKKNAKGYMASWNGYKLHVDVNDLGLPLSAALTSASVHDSQVAIPLIKATSSKVQYCYDLMDAAYDSHLIKKVSQQYGHVPIIDQNKRNGQKLRPMAPHEKQRYKQRGAVERFNGRLKEEFGGRDVMVKGADKVMMHLMFGVLAVFADQLIKVVVS
jgi:hypothetical protein